MKAPKKLIEVALPLDDINAAAAREKSIRHGHPSTLHLWWARRPLAAARAVLFAQLVNDPGGERGWGRYRGQTKEDAQKERERLFDILRELVKWENTNNEEVLERARAEIRKSWREMCEMNGWELDTPMPPLHDPFAGGGAIPLEAQRLGLEAHASDLNPVAVLINKAMIEIPPKFAGRTPVGPLPEDKTQTSIPKTWPGATGLAEDVRRYGAWMREEAFKRIGHLYPEVELPKEHGGGKATVIAWLWARTVKSPNPALHSVQVPLVSSFWLSKKKGKEAYVEPIVEGNNYRFIVHRGKPQNGDVVNAGTKTGRGANFRCLITGSPISSDYVKKQGKQGNLGFRMMAIVAAGNRKRIYCDPTEEHEKFARKAKPTWRPDAPMSTHPQYMSVTNYIDAKWSSMFTDRQTLALQTFSNLVSDAKIRATEDARIAGWQGDTTSLFQGGKGATAYGEAVALYLGLSVGRLANRQSISSFWHTSGEKVEQVFARQALPFVWDTAEGNPFSTSSGNYIGQLGYLTKVVGASPKNVKEGTVLQSDARNTSTGKTLISTDPPYYDNVPYADLSDFFYVWLRYALKDTAPSLFGTMLVPKNEELVADHQRHGGRREAETYFLQGMQEAMHRMAERTHDFAPATIYYAFKQAESGWETFLDAILVAGFSITGTWPVRTELVGNLKKNWNALASSIILVCRPRSQEAPTVTRRQFLRELRETMPEALEDMIGGAEGISPIAPVDLAQAAIGPGMAIFSKYVAVLEADGSQMSIKDALAHINAGVDHYFSEAEGYMDPDTRFCIDWFQQFGFNTGAFGEADVLARAKGTSVEGLVEAGVTESGSGKVRLLKVTEYPSTWDPQMDHRTPVWEACHQMARALGESEGNAGELLARMPDKQDPIRRLAYRLYTLCERKGWADEARMYNVLIGSWHGIVEQSHDMGRAGTQTQLDL